MGYRETACLTMGCSTWNISCPSLLTDLGACRAVAFTLSCSSFTAAVHWFFCLLLNVLSQGFISTTDGLSFGQWAVLELARTGCLWGQLLLSSHRSHPCSHPSTATKPCHINLIVTLLKGSDLHMTNTQNVSWWSSELLCVLQLHIREMLHLCLRKDFTFQAECKFTLKRGSQIDLCYYCIFNWDGNIESVLIIQDLSICCIPIPFHTGVLKLE